LSGQTPFVPPGILDGKWKKGENSAAATGRVDADDCRRGDPATFRGNEGRRTAFLCGICGSTIGEHVDPSRRVHGVTGLEDRGPIVRRTQGCDGSHRDLSKKAIEIFRDESGGKKKSRESTDGGTNHRTGQKGLELRGENGG